MNAAFLTELELCEADPNVDDGKWRVMEALGYRSGIFVRDFQVPVGFVTDLASVPRLPIVYWLCGGRANKPAVLHDFLYSTGLVPRAHADAIFREAMAVVGVSRIIRNLMWLGVRLGGASHYTTQ